MMRILLLVAGVSLLLVTAAQAVPGNTSGPWGVNISGFANFSTASTSSATLGKTIVVDRQATVNNCTVTGRTVHVPRGGSINIPSGRTLTISDIDAGPYQIFTGSGTVSGLAKSRPEWWGARASASTDDTSAFGAAIAAVAPGGLVQGNTSASYLIGAVPTITKPITVDFAHAYIRPNTTGIMFSLQQANPDQWSNRIILENATIIPGTVNPSDIVRVLYGGINPTLHNFNIQGVTATHAYIWNYASYGLKISDSKFRQGSVPAVIYLSHSNTDPTIFSNTVDIDHIDISNVNGIGVYAEGGIFTIRGQSVIEGCTGGGVVHASVAYANKIVISDSYFEQNYAHDINFGATTGGNYTIRDCFFGDGSLVTSSYNHVATDYTSVLTLIGNTFSNGGVSGYPPLSYVSINNSVRSYPVTGYSSAQQNVELSDAIQGSVKKSTLQPQNSTKLFTVAPSSSLTVVSNQPLTGTAYDEWKIAGSTNLHNGISELFRLLVNRQDTTITGAIITDKHDLTPISAISVVDGTGKYNIVINNTSTSTMYYLVTYIDNYRMY